MKTVKLAKTIRGWQALSRLIVELDESPVGEIPRKGLPQDRYCFGPTYILFRRKSGGLPLFWVERTHRIFDVYEVSEERRRV